MNQLKRLRDLHGRARTMRHYKSVVVAVLSFLLGVLAGCGVSDLDVPHYSQLEPPYAAVKLGGRVVSDVGCMAMCLAMLADYHADTNPMKLLAAFQARAAFAPSGDLLWGNALRALRMATGRTWEHKNRVQSVRYYLNRGIPVLARKKGHWRVIVGTTASGLSRCLDPAEGPGLIEIPTLDFDRFDVWVPAEKLGRE